MTVLRSAERDSIDTLYTSDLVVSLTYTKELRMPFTLPELPYAEDSLAPHIDAATMNIHRTKHHNAYVTNLNKALEAHADWSNRSIDDICKNITNVPEAVRGAVRNNGGGHFNHSLFWQVLAPAGKGGQPSAELSAAITKAFTSIDEMKAKFAAAATGRFGSGWAWLVRKSDGTLAITSTPNQDNPLMTGVAELVATPILGLDVWEHAYYLNYQNRRPDYVTAFWSVVNWSEVSKRFAAQ